MLTEGFMRNQGHHPKEYSTTSLIPYYVYKIPRNELISARTKPPLSNVNEYRAISPCTILVPSYATPNPKSTSVDLHIGQMPVAAVLTEGFLGNQGTQSKA
jgi:hypothetical protein